MEFKAELDKVATVRGGVKITLRIDFEDTPPEEIDYDELMSMYGRICRVELTRSTPL